MSEEAGRDLDRPQMASAKGRGIGPVTPGTSEVGTDAHLSSLFSLGLLVIVGLLSGREKTGQNTIDHQAKAQPHPGEPRGGWPEPARFWFELELRFFFFFFKFV